MKIQEYIYKAINFIVPRIWLLFLIDLFWRTLEILLDGGVQPSWADTIICLVLIELIYRELERIGFVK